jgi:hypothetical protein
MQLATRRTPALDHLSFSFAALLAAVFLLGGSCAHAHTFCVSTATDLQNALTDSSDGGMYSGQSNSILIATGTYLTGAATSNQPFHFISTSTTGFLTIGGGYSGCAVATHDPSQTILDGNHATKVMSLFSTSTEIVIQGLTFQNGDSSDGGGGLAINTQGGYNASIFLERCIVRNNHSDSLGGGFYFGADGTGHHFYLQYNLIYANSADGIGGGAGYLSSNGAGATLLGNTITGNTASGLTATGGIVDSIVGSTAVRNNILWNNSHADAFFSGSNVNFSYNGYFALAGAAPGTTTGNLQLNPQFVNSASGNFRLARTSPLLAFIPNPDSANTDLIGNSHPAGGNGDAGAYEETVFTDGFDGD